MITDALNQAGENIVQFFNSTLPSTVEWGKGMISNAAETMKGFATSFVQGLSSAWDSFKSFMSATGEAISKTFTPKNVAVAVGAGVALAGIAAIGGWTALPAVATLVGATAFANGGVLTSPTVGLIGEYSGASHNPEIVSPQSIMRETVEEATNTDDVVNAIYTMANMVVQAVNNKDFDIQLDGVSLARKMYNPMQTVSKQRGNRLVNV